VRINQDGYRDRPHAHHRPANTFRIAVLGDSFAEALQVSREETFWSVLERELQDAKALDGQSVEVLNFGVSGFGTAQALEMLRHYVWQYEPNLVLLAFLTGNDISDNSKRLSPDAVRPYYLPGPSGLVLDQSFRQHPFYVDAQSDFSKLKVTWINRLRILQVIRQLRAQSRPRAPQPGPTAEPGVAPIYAPPQDDAWKEAWEITEQLLVLMHDEVRSHDAEFLVVVLSNSEQVHPDKQRRADLQKQLGVADLWYADRRVESFCQQEGIPVLLLAPGMQRYAEQHQVYLHGFPNTELGNGHWNADGHALAGKILADEICRKESLRN
jgi:lysophospholipase L1-like esterase